MRPTNGSVSAPSLLEGNTKQATVPWKDRFKLLYKHHVSNITGMKYHRGPINQALVSTCIQPRNMLDQVRTLLESSADPNTDRSVETSTYQTENMFCGGTVEMKVTGDFSMYCIWRPCSTATSEDQDEPLAHPRHPNRSVSNRLSLSEKVKNTLKTLRRPRLTHADPSVHFSVQISKLRQLTNVYACDFKRIRGDIWQYKRLYEDLTAKLNFGEEKHETH